MKLNELFDDLSTLPALIQPALALAIVGVVQGAAISHEFPNPDGSKPDPSGDFKGQGMANIITGFFQGMPVGGSFSATSILVSAGARTRFANIVSGLGIAGVEKSAHQVLARTGKLTVMGSENVFAVSTHYHKSVIEARTEAETWINQ